MDTTFLSLLFYSSFNNLGNNEVQRQFSLVELIMILDISTSNVWSLLQNCSLCANELELQSSIGRCSSEVVSQN